MLINDARDFMGRDIKLSKIMIPVHSRGRSRYAKLAKKCGLAFDICFLDKDFNA